MDEADTRTAAKRTGMEPGDGPIMTDQEKAILAHARVRLDGLFEQVQHFRRRLELIEDAEKGLDAAAVSDALAAERVRLVEVIGEALGHALKELRDEIEKQIDSKVGELRTEMNVMRAAMTSWKLQGN